MMAAMAGPKLTGVGRLLNAEHRSPAVTLPIPREKFEDPTFIPRLSFRSSPRVPVSQPDLTSNLALHVDHALFVDTNMVNADHDWWNVLLSEPGRVFLTPRVLQEMMPYFANHRDHPLLRAFKDGDPALVMHSEPGEQWSSRVAFDYYVHLLSYRRYQLIFRVLKFKERIGREPTDAELAEIRMKLQRHLGERGFMLNKKKISRYRTDEALVYLAVAHALRTGQSTKIFSADLDVEDQFYTLLRLITTHYYGMLLGRLYLRDFAWFRPKPVPAQLLADPKSMIEPHGATLIDLRGRGIHDFLPKPFQFVPISCTTIGNEYVSEITYGAETAMAEVLRIKDTTEGLSTDCLGGRNVHPWLIPPQLNKLLPRGVLVAYDKRDKVLNSRAQASRLDLMHAVWPGDPHAVVERSPESKTVLLRHRRH